MSIPIRILVAASAAGVCAFPAVGAASSRRFLLLHNSRTSGSAFEASPTKNGAKYFLSGVPRRTDAGGNAAPPNWLYASVDSGVPDGGWWSGDKYKGLDASIAKVEEVREPEQAPIPSLTILSTHRPPPADPRCRPWRTLARWV